MYKTKLQEFCHKNSWNLPEYTTVRDGPDHIPRFTATVTVNGLTFETPKNQCNSSKEAQNLAAQIAFDSLTSTGRQPQPQPQCLPLHNAALSPSLASPSSSGSFSSNTHPGFSLTNEGILHPKQEKVTLECRNNKVPIGSENDRRPKEMLHMYKNWLQQYAQKHAASFPVYTHQFDGPPHSRRFKAKVTLGDKSYETSEMFSTLKEAEQVAAKIAFESLSHDDIQEDEVLYKTLLQQLAQKEGLLFPTYITTRSGPSHMPSFASTVEVGTDIFVGPEAKTKKQAEMRAAKVAYTALTGKSNLMEASEMTSSSARSVATGNLPSKAEVIAAQEPDAKVQDVQIYRFSSSSVKVNAHLQEPLPPSSSSPHDPASTPPVQLMQPNVNAYLQDPLPLSSSSPRNPALTPPEQLKQPNGSAGESENQKPAGMPSGKVIVYPRNSDMAVPDGATMLDFNDDKWVAFELNQPQ